MEDPDPTLPPPPPRPFRTVGPEAVFTLGGVLLLPCGIAVMGSGRGSPGSASYLASGALLLAAVCSMAVGGKAAGRWACLALGVMAVVVGHAVDAWSALSPQSHALLWFGWTALWIAGIVVRAGDPAPPRPM